MPHKKLVPIGALVILMLMTSSAYALSVKICFKIDLNLYDAMDEAGDYINSNIPITGYGIKAKVGENGNGPVLFETWTDSDTGCTPYLTMSSAKSYYIRAYSMSKSVDTNYVKVYTSSTEEYYFTNTLDADFTPAASGTYTFNYDNFPDILDGFNEGNVLAVASYAIRRKPAGLTAEWFKFYRETCSGDGLGNACFKNGAIYIDDENNIAQNNKTGITHEMGHAVGYKSNNYQNALHDYTDTGDDDIYEGDDDSSPTPTPWPCYSTSEGHHENSRELQRGAAVEGIAHFYAASIWNIKNDGDCWFRGLDCQDDEDYMHDICDPPFTNRAVESDWLRFWWDVYEDMDLTVAEIFELWDLANPNNWTNASVFERLRNAADAMNLSLTLWDNLADANGVDQGVW
ncbi:MAG: hypothetical protein GX444_02320 [Myxococcales bacterium]|nr:hypothetical protein [Myxococcales bacterium]